MLLRITVTFILVMLFAVSGAIGADRDRNPDESRKSTPVKSVKAEKTVQRPTPKPVATSVELLPETTPSAPIVSDPSRAGEEVHWQVIASGGGRQTLGSLILGSTVGQTFAGTSTLGTMTLNSGFWQNWATSGSCCEVRGDANGSGDGPDISDIVYFVDWLFLGGTAISCPEEGDNNASGGDPDITDLVYMVDYVFLGGAAPIPCP